MEVNRTNKDMIMSIHVYQTDPFRVMKNSESHFFPYHGTNIFLATRENKSSGLNTCLTASVTSHDLGLCGESENSTVGSTSAISAIPQLI